MRSWRASSSRQSFSAIFSYSACTAPEVTDSENKHDEEGDRRDARGLGEKMQRAALEPDERKAEHGDHRGPAARDAARAGENPESGPPATARPPPAQSRAPAATAGPAMRAQEA